MKAQLEQIRRAAKEALASFDSAEQLEKARIQYLGKKGELTADRPTGKRNSQGH